MASMELSSKSRAHHSRHRGANRTCFVCNQQFDLSKSAEDEDLEELNQIKILFYDVFEISRKRKPEPFKESPFCRACEIKAKEIQRISLEIQALQEQLGMVRDEMASAIVTTYIYSSKESPNFEMKHLIFERWYDKIQHFKVHESPLRDTEPKPNDAIKLQLQMEKEQAPVPSATFTKSTKRSELEVAQLIKQNEERLNCDPNSDKVEEAICLICSKVFRTKNLLEVHTKTHGEERPYGCRVCTKSFYGKATLKKHTQLKHPEHDKIQSTTPSDTVIPSAARATNEVNNKSDTMDSSELRDEAETSPVRQKPMKRKLIQCEMCGKIQPHRKALQKHIKKEHTHKIPCSFCGKGCRGACKGARASKVKPDSVAEPINQENEAEIPRTEDYSSDHFDDFDNNSENQLPSAQDERFSIWTDKEEVKKFKTLKPKYKNISFNVFIKIERLSDSKTAPDTNEEEPRPAHILKSVAWKANGAWFTQEKTVHSTVTTKPLCLQSKWQTFLQKAKPKSNSERTVNRISNNSTTPTTTAPSSPAPPPAINQTEKEDEAEPEIFAYTPMYKDLLNDEDKDLTKDGDKLPIKTEEPLSKDTDQTLSEEESLNVRSNPSPSMLSSDSKSAKRATNCSYWLDPKNVILSDSPGTDTITTSPYLGQTKSKAKLEAILRKPGPHSKKKLADITLALKLGKKKRGPIPKPPAIPPGSRPSSEQITKLARQLRKSGVGITKGRFDPVFQLHALGASSQSAAARIPTTLALNKDFEVHADHGNENNSNRKGKRNRPLSNEIVPPPFVSMPIRVPPPAPILSETSVEVETDILTLMQNSNVTVLPSCAVRTVGHATHDIQRSLKRMAGPRSKTKVSKPLRGTIEQASSQSSSSSNSSFRFVDVQDLLSRRTEESNTIQHGITSATVVSTCGNSRPDNLGNHRESAKSNGQSQPYNSSLIDSCPTTQFTTEDTEHFLKPVKIEDKNSDIEVIDSDSDFDDAPKIRIRNIQSLAEPQQFEESDSESDSEDHVMDVEDVETYQGKLLGEVVETVNAKSSSDLCRDGVRFPANAESSAATIDKNGIFNYTSANVHRVFNATKPQQPEVLTRTGPRPKPQSSPPPETYVYHLTPEALQAAGTNKDFAGPVITNVFKVQPQSRPSTPVVNNSAPTRFVVSGHSTVRVSTVPQRTSANLSTIPEDDLDLLLGL